MNNTLYVTVIHETEATYTMPLDWLMTNEKKITALDGADNKKG